MAAAALIERQVSPQLRRGIVGQADPKPADLGDPSGRLGVEHRRRERQAAAQRGERRTRAQEARLRDRQRGVCLGPTAVPQQLAPRVGDLSVQDVVPLGLDLRQLKLAQQLIERSVRARRVQPRPRHPQPRPSQRVGLRQPAVQHAIGGRWPLLGVEQLRADDPQRHRRARGRDPPHQRLPHPLRPAGARDVAEVHEGARRQRPVLDEGRRLEVGHAGLRHQPTGPRRPLRGRCGAAIGQLDAPPRVIEPSGRELILRAVVHHVTAHQPVQREPGRAAVQPRTAAELEAALEGVVPQH